MDSIWENQEDFWLGITFKLGFQGSIGRGQIGESKELLWKWNVSHGQEIGEIRDAQEKLGTWSMKYLKSEVRGADGQCSGMGPGRGQKPLIDSVEGIVVFPHSTDREFRERPSWLLLASRT